MEVTEKMIDSGERVDPNDYAAKGAWVKAVLEAALAAAPTPPNDSSRAKALDTAIECLAEFGTGADCKEAREVLKRMRSVPTPPAREDEPHSWVACSVGVEAPIRELRVSCHAQMEMYRDLGWTITSLYTRPADDKLRKVAKELLAIADGKGRTDMFERTVEKLRAELESKPTPLNTDKQSPG